MPLFKFRAADPAGAIQEILVEGLHQEEATRRVRGRGLVPVECLGQGDAAAAAGGVSQAVGWRWGDRFDAVDFTDRLAPLLEAQIPLERALGILEDTCASPNERLLVGELRRGLHEGRKLSQLVRDQGRRFPGMYASIVAAGEESGALPQVMSQLRDFLVMTRDLNNFIITASIYPLFVLSFSLAVVAVLLGVVVPKLGTVILSSGGAPSLGTSVLLTLSAGVRGYWWAGGLALGAGFLALRWAWRVPAFRAWLDALLLRVPLLREMVILANMSRLARTMALLIRSGVHILNSVAISSGTLQNTVLRESVSTVTADLRRGERLSAALGRSPYLPRLMIRMVAVGEETGETDRMLDRVADRYDADLRQLVKRALAWFEPLIILTLGGMVGSIVFMMFLAILDMWNRL